MAKSGRESYLPVRPDVANLVLHYEDEAMAQSHPALYQLLCHAKRDGKFRAGARLTLFCEQGRLKASLSDPDTSQVWFGTLEGWQGCLDAIEALLVARRGEWRESRPRGR